MGSEKRARQKAGRQQRIDEEQQVDDRERRKSVIIRLGILAVVVIAAIALWVVLTSDDGGDSTEETATDQTSTTATNGTTIPPADPDYTPYTAEQYGDGECAPTDGVDEPVLEFQDAPQLCIEPGAAYTARFETTAGDIVVELDAGNTPGTANNFINLSRAGYYDGTLVHRSDPSIGILQGGSPHTNSASDPGPGYTIFDEGTGFTYRPGQLVMARTGQADSASGQYFFSVTDAVTALDSQGTYVVFGVVTEGLDVLDALLASHADDPENALGGSPDPEVTVISVTITEGTEAAGANVETP
jgi:cyclophilin family peptidyl-prolyl cis-trans isomerase